MRLNEMFISIQGEGPNAGRRALFVRFSGCNLKCNWCDSKYANHIYADVDWTEIASMIDRTHIHYIVLTGGEPTIQKDLDKLLEFLAEARTGVFEVDVETNGTNLPDKERQYVNYIVSPKSVKTAQSWLQYAEDNPNQRRNWVFKFVINLEHMVLVLPWIKKHCTEPVWLMPLTSSLNAPTECMVKELVSAGKIVTSEMIKYGIDGFLCTRLQNLYRVR